MPCAPLQYQIVTLPPDCADFYFRTGDCVPGPDGTMYRVVLLIGPRTLIARTPLWHDHLWLWIAWMIDYHRLGARPSTTTR